MPALSMRLKRLTDAADLLRFLYVEEPLSLSAQQLTHKQMGESAALEAFQRTRALVYGMDRLDDAEVLSAGMRAIGESVTSNKKAGPFLGTARLAITGQKISPPLFESMIAMGRKQLFKTVRRDNPPLRNHIHQYLNPFIMGNLAPQRNQAPQASNR